MFFKRAIIVFAVVFVFILCVSVIDNVVRCKPIVYPGVRGLLSPDGSGKTLTMNGPENGPIAVYIWEPGRNFNKNTERSYLAIGGTDELSAFNPVWAPDGKSIAFVEQRGQASGLAIGSVNGTDTSWISRNDGGIYTDIIWSADGKLIAYIKDRGYTHDIWIYDFRTGIETNITNSGTIESDVVWSPDGTRLAYLVDFHRIYVAGSTGENPTFLYESSSRVWEMIWLKSGIVFSISNPDTSFQREILMKLGFDGKVSLLPIEEPLLGWLDIVNGRMTYTTGESVEKPSAIKVTCIE